METMTVTYADRFATSSPTATVWGVDPARSIAEFSVVNRLLLIIENTVHGEFGDIQGTIMLDEQDLTRSRAELVIGAASLDTANARRDKHLKAADFFNVARYPRITFTSGSVEAVDAAAGRYRATGDLTLLGVTRPVTLDVQYTPSRPTAGEPRIKLTGTTTISRRDFGMNYQSLVGRPANEVRVRVAIEATPTSRGDASIFVSTRGSSFSC